MAKKKTAGQKAAATRAAKPATLLGVDALIARALNRLNSNPSDIAMAKRALTNARTELRKACTFPKLDE